MLLTELLGERCAHDHTTDAGGRAEVVPAGLSPGGVEVAVDLRHDGGSRWAMGGVGCRGVVVAVAVKERSRKAGAQCSKFAMLEFRVLARALAVAASEAWRVAYGRCGRAPLATSPAGSSGHRARVGCRSKGGYHSCYSLRVHQHV